MQPKDLDRFARGKAQELSKPSAMAFVILPG